MFDVRVSGQVQAESDGGWSRTAKGEEEGLGSEASARKVTQYDHEGEATQQGASGAYAIYTSMICFVHAVVVLS